MSSSTLTRAVQNYRNRLTQRGMARFEVVGRESDRELIRSFARFLAEVGLEADMLGVAAKPNDEGERPPKIGGILAALRHSPLVGADVIPDRRKAQTGDSRS